MVEQNYTLPQACEVAGAGPTAVKRWRQQYLAEQAGKPLPNRRALTPEMREIQQLKQRINSTLSD
jgi:transposase